MNIIKMMLIDHEKVDNCIEMRRSQSSHVPIIRYQLKNMFEEYFIIRRKYIAIRSFFIIIILLFFCINDSLATNSIEINSGNDYSSFFMS